MNRTRLPAISQTDITGVCSFAAQAKMHSLQYFQALSQGSEINFFPHETKLLFIPLS